MDRLLRALDRKDPRLPSLIAFLLITFLIIESWFLVLRKPFAQYQLLTLTVQNLTANINARGGPSREIEDLRNELKELKGNLDQEMKLVQSGDLSVATVVNKIDGSARQSGVRLLGVTPGARKKYSDFEEFPILLTLTGEYLSVARWLQNSGKELGKNIVTTGFEMKPSEQSKYINLNLSVALYSINTINGAP